jgi:hypothetical protein
MGRVETGRIYPRLRQYECESCHQRNSIGKPRASDTWPAQLFIPERMMDVLLLAAAEFRDLCVESGVDGDAIDFLDWVRPDAIRPGFGSPVTAEPEPPSLAEKRRRAGVA